MVPQNQLIAFTLDERRFAISLDSVLRVIPALEVTFLPQAPRYVVGAINVEGRIFQVLNVRKMCGVPERDIVGYCCRCGYDLTGNISGVCPECGKPVPTADEPQ